MSTPRRNTRYLSLDEAVFDDSQPEFDAMAYARDEARTPTSATQLLGGYPPADTSYEAYYKNPRPSSQHFPQVAPQKRRKHPFADSHFEAPHWQDILIHAILCFLAYPLIFLFAFLASNKTLFWTRFIVGLGSGIIGVAVGTSLLRLAQAHLEATTWATVIHQSHVDESQPGVRLEDLDASTRDATGVLNGVRLMWNRWMYSGTSRSARVHYDRRPWSVFIVLFLVAVTVAGTISFVVGRLVEIKTALSHQLEIYEEIAVMGGNSDDDIARATSLAATFNDYALTWTLQPFTTNGGLPPVISFQFNETDTVYFSEVVTSQLIPGGNGFGDFGTQWVEVSTGIDKTKEVLTTPATQEVDPGALLRFPRWGIRIHCAKVPDPDINIVLPTPNSTSSYLYTPKSVLESLFASFNMEYPALPPFNASKVLLPGDKLPPGLDPNATAIGSVFYDNAAAVSPFSYPISLGQDGKGWVSIEEVFVRLNTTYAPNGTFARLSNDSVPDQYGNATYIGYDAAVCVELFEPWVLEVYNSTTGAPVSMRLVEQGGVVQSRPPAPGVEEQLSGPPLSITDTNVIRQLDSSNLANVYITAHQNSVNQLTKDNGRDSYYVPCPTLLSFTSGRGSLGYTELSPSMFAESRGLSDGSNLLPYFAGTGQMLARRYNDRVLSNAYARPIYAALYLAFILILGLVVGLFVPKLPLGVPHRDFNMYTWMAAFQAEELVGESIKLPGISRNMALDNIAEQVGGLKFRYVNPQTRSGY